VTAYRKTSRMIDHVAWDIGYEDSGRSGKYFTRFMGRTPGDYRKRFAVTSSA
jgi:transcriptional regulator GlxA family with amidase domain